MALYVPGIHFTCFTGTRVQILTQKALMALYVPGIHVTCFSATRVQILTQKALPVREFLSEYTTKPVTFSSPDKESAAAAKQVYAALSCACMRP
jgi:hypothetical protein